MHPDYQGKGIGTMMVKYGIDAAERMGIDIFVLAFEMGVEIYRKLGFELLEQITLDDSEFGGAGVFHRYYFERKSGGSSALKVEE